MFATCAAGSTIPPWDAPKRASLPALPGRMCPKTLNALCAAPRRTSSPKPENSIIMEDLDKTIQDSDLTLVDFYATWCGPCKMLSPVLEQLKADLGDGIRIVKVDVDKNAAMSTRYRIRSVPTLILFKRGAMVWRQSGTMGLDDLKAQIDKHR